MSKMALGSTYTVTVINFNLIIVNSNMIWNLQTVVNKSLRVTQNPTISKVYAHTSAEGRKQKILLDKCFYK